MRVRVRAVRWLTNINPGAIEAYLTDSDGFDWQIVAKYVDFAEYAELGPWTEFPREVSIGCEVPNRGHVHPDCAVIEVDYFTHGRYEVPLSALIDDPN